MNNHEKKSIAKSIRITPSVYDAILSFKGEGFNDKLCNLVNYSIHYKDKLNKEIETKKQKLSALETESSRKLKELNNLNIILPMLFISLKLPSVAP